MANTYELIASNTLGSAAASVTFSAIPNTFGDLLLKASVRSTYSSTEDSAKLTFNGSTVKNYPTTILTGTGSTAQSSAWTSSTFSYSYIENCFTGNTATANTFASIEIYIPKYLASANKPFSIFDTCENNNAAARMQIQASQWTSTAAITSIEIASANVVNLAAGSSFFLYGIKNS